MFKSFRASRLLLTTLLILFAFFTSAVFRASAVQPVAGPQPAATESDPLKVLQWRAIGPFRGGRSTAVTGRRFTAHGLLLRWYGGGRLKTHGRRHQLGRQYHRSNRPWAVKRRPSPPSTARRETDQWRAIAVP